MMLVFMHTATIFTLNGGSVVKGPPNTAIVAVSTFFGEFLMPLMFFIAGASVWLALGRRSPGGYLGERVKRLLVPLAFGIVAVLPILSYLYAVNREDYHGSFFGTYLPMLAHFPFGHLWFILYLFIFSVAALPFFLYLRSLRGSRFTARLGSLCDRRGGLILFFVPLTLLELVRRVLPNPNDNNAARLLLIAFFVYGFLVFSDPRIGRAIERNRKSDTGHGRIGLDRRGVRHCGGRRIVAVDVRGARPAGDGQRNVGDRDRAQLREAILEHGQQGPPLPEPGFVPVLHPPLGADRRDRLLRDEVEPGSGGELPHHRARLLRRHVPALRGRGQEDKRDAPRWGPGRAS
jgi:hypothetical protein